MGHRERRQKELQYILLLTATFSLFLSRNLLFMMIVFAAECILLIKCVNFIMLRYCRPLNMQRAPPIVCVHPKHAVTSPRLDIQFRNLVVRDYLFLSCFIYIAPNVDAYVISLFRTETVPATRLLQTALQEGLQLKNNNQN